MFHNTLADAQTGLQTVLICAAEMDAAIKTAQSRFRSGGRETGEVALNPGEKVRTGGESHVIGAVEKSQNSGSCTTEGAVPRDIVGERGRDDERAPVRVRISVRIPIGVSLPNCCHWAPKAVMVLGLPGADGGV